MHTGEAPLDSGTNAQDQATTDRLLEAISASLDNRIFLSRGGMVQNALQPMEVEVTPSSNTKNKRGRKKRESESKGPSSSAKPKARDTMYDTFVGLVFGELHKEIPPLPSASASTSENLRYHELMQQRAEQKNLHDAYAARPDETKSHYSGPCVEFINWCKEQNFIDGHIVHQTKVLRFMHEYVEKKQKKPPKAPKKKKSIDEMDSGDEAKDAIKYSNGKQVASVRVGLGENDVVLNEDSENSSDEEVEEGGGEKSSHDNAATVINVVSPSVKKKYIFALVYLHQIQLKLRINNHPSPYDQDNKSLKEYLTTANANELKSSR